MRRASPRADVDDGPSRQLALTRGHEHGERCTLHCRQNLRRPLAAPDVLIDGVDVLLVVDDARLHFFYVIKDSETQRERLELESRMLARPTPRQKMADAARPPSMPTQSSP